MLELKVITTFPSRIIFPVEIRKINLTLPLNLLRDNISGGGIEFSLEIDEGIPDASFYDDLSVNHGGLVISGDVIRYFNTRWDKSEFLYTLKINIITDIKTISEKASAPEEIYKDIIFNICTYIQALFNIIGPTRLSPIIVVNNEKILFNARIAYLMLPGQDWFHSRGLNEIILDLNIYKQTPSSEKHYELMLPYLNDWFNKPIVFEDLKKIAESSYSNNINIFNYGRLLSDIIRQHPSFDLSSIIASLTSFIEGFLSINQEHRYKFQIKICNLLNSQELRPILKTIYDKRSTFYHTAVYGKINDIFEFAPINFLILIISEIFKFDISDGISVDSFDFPLNKAN